MKHLPYDPDQEQRCTSCKRWFGADGGYDTVSGLVCVACSSDFKYGVNKHLNQEQLGAIIHAGQNALKQLPDESLEILGLVRYRSPMGRESIKPK